MTCGSRLGADAAPAAVDDLPLVPIDGLGDEKTGASDDHEARDGADHGDKNPWLPGADYGSPSVDVETTESGVPASTEDNSPASEPEAPPVSGPGIAAEPSPDLGSAPTSHDETFPSPPRPTPSNQGLLPPPPPATDQSWTPPSPSLGIPPSLMPPTGEAPDGQARPPAPGSSVPMQQAQATLHPTPPPPATQHGQVVPEGPEAVVMDVGPADPHGLGNAMARLNPVTRPHAEIPALIAAARLRSDEQVDLVVPGVVDGVVGVAVVTPERVLLVNGRQWSPVVFEFALEAGLEVQGWQDETYAQLTFRGATVGRLEAIIDHSLAFDAARLIRERVPSQGL